MPPGTIVAGGNSTDVELVVMTAKGADPDPGVPGPKEIPAPAADPATLVLINRTGPATSRPGVRVHTA
jgi:hypothetical protein